MMRIRFTNTNTGRVTEMVVTREYKSCYSCKVTNHEHYTGNFRIYKNWIGAKNDGFKVETF